jgi:DNA-binding GntR family transcriptional regulator
MKKVKTRSIDISAQIAQQIRDMIARGILSPGVHLIPTRLAEQIADMVARGNLAPGVSLSHADDTAAFTVSRMPIREALKLLVGEGVIERDLNRGFFVASLSSDEASQLYQLRRAIEARLLLTVVWPNAAQLRQLRALKKAMQTFLDEGNLTQWLYKNRELHQMIFELSPRKILVREALRLWTLCDRYRSLLIATFSNNAMADTEHLIDALTKRDRERLILRFEEDLALIERNLLNVLAARGL